MGIHHNIVAAATRLAGAIPVMKSYDLEGNLHLVVSDEEHVGPLGYTMEGTFDTPVMEQVFQRDFQAEIYAAGYACCAH